MTVFALPLGDQTPPESATSPCQSVTFRVNHAVIAYLLFGNNGYDRPGCLHRVMRLISEIGPVGTRTVAKWTCNNNNTPGRG